MRSIGIAAICLLSLIRYHLALICYNNYRPMVSKYKQHQQRLYNPWKSPMNPMRASSQDISEGSVDGVDLNPRPDERSISNVTFSAEIVAILTVYFVQGALGLARLATTFFLKDQLHLNPAESAALLGLTSLPWIIKPIYGFLSDEFPILGYRRRSYLAIAGIVGCLSWLALGVIVHDSMGALIATIAGSMSIAVSDVVVDSIVVERSKTAISSHSKDSMASDTESGLMSNDSLPKQTVDLSVAGDLQSLCWAASSIGGICSAYFSGSLLQTLTPQTVFLITAIFPLLISLVSFLIKENPIKPHSKLTDSSLFDKLRDLFASISIPSIYLPVIFVFLWQATPSAGSAMFYFYTNNLGFNPEFLGRLSLVSSIASLGGVLVYRNWLKTMPIKKILFYTALASVPLGLSQLLLTTHYNREIGIPDQFFTLTDSVVLTVLGQVSFMPILALAASLCPPGVEGTLFATLMSIYNAAGTLSNEMGAGLTSYLGITESNFDNISWLIIICSLSSLLPLPFMNVLLGDSYNNTIIENSDEINNIKAD